MNWDIASFTDKGEREKNEDSIELIQAKAGICAVLCDGLGGHSAGELASQCVCESIKKQFLLAEADRSLEELTPQCMDEAQEALLKRQEELGKAGGMKTTCCCLSLRDGMAVAAYVGDSRIYQFRRGRVLRQSLDHSLCQYLVKSGEIKPRDIRHHPDRNKLLRVMGTEWGSPQYQRLDIATPKPGDAFLLCSDGFWEWITEREMQRLLRKASCADEWIKSMYEIILGRGHGQGMDNISAIALIAAE